MERDLLVAHAAGILDGEGCFGIDRRDGCFYPRIQVVMTALKPIRILQGLFGGGVFEHKKNANYKQAYHYTCNGTKTSTLIEQVLPFLIEKREQAEVLLDLGKNIAEWNSKPRQRGNLPPDVIAYRSELKTRASSLKMSSVMVRPIRNLSEKKRLAYLCGVLEAEGCFSIGRGPGNGFFSTVTVQMSTLAVLEDLQEIFGGTILLRKKTPPLRDVFMWRVKGRAAADLCRRITPYLSFRHEEADLIRQLQNTTDLWAKKVGRGGMPQEITDKRIQWINRIHDIHSPNRARAETKPESTDNREVIVPSASSS